MSTSRPSRWPTPTSPFRGETARQVSPTARCGLNHARFRTARRSTAAGFDCCFGGDFWSVDKKGCVLAPRGAGAGEDDHVMGDDPDMDQLLDTSGAQRGPSHLPKAAAVIAK